MLCRRAGLISRLIRTPGLRAALKDTITEHGLPGEMTVSGEIRNGFAHVMGVRWSGGFLGFSSLIIKLAVGLGDRRVPPASGARVSGIGYAASGLETWRSVGHGNWAPQRPTRGMTVRL